MDFEKLEETSDQLNSELENVLEKLFEIKDIISNLNEVSGINQKFAEVQEEIELFGWNSILELFHPDNNCDNPAAHQIFDFYKFVYDRM